MINTPDGLGFLSFLREYYCPAAACAGAFCTFAIAAGFCGSKSNDNPQPEPIPDPEPEPTPVDPTPDFSNESCTDRKLFEIQVHTTDAGSKAATHLSSIKTPRTERLVWGENERHNGWEDKTHTNIYQWWPGIPDGKAQIFARREIDTSPHRAHGIEILPLILTPTSVFPSKIYHSRTTSES